MVCTDFFFFFFFVCLFRLFVSSDFFFFLFQPCRNLLDHLKSSALCFSCLLVWPSCTKIGLFIEICEKTPFFFCFFHFCFFQEVILCFLCLVLFLLKLENRTSNLLMDNKGTLKIADFGLARSFGEPLKPLTPGVVTLWYRAPELLLGGDRFAYSTAVDVWSCGCIFGEFIRNQILIQGTNEMDQIKKIFRLLGTPDEGSWPNWRKLPGARNVQFQQQKNHILGQKFTESELTPQGTHLMLRLLCFDPERRESAQQALQHPFFTTEKPRPKGVQ
jgi:serine/threonine protein kinase